MWRAFAYGANRPCLQQGFTAEELEILDSVWESRLEVLQNAVDLAVWNPVQGALAVSSLTGVAVRAGEVASLGQDEYDATSPPGIERMSGLARWSDESDDSDMGCLSSVVS